MQAKTSVNVSIQVKCATEFVQLEQQNKQKNIREKKCM